MNRVLIIDDDPNILELAAQLFEAHLWQVRIAATGEQALLMFAAERPHLIVLDLGLPGADGLEILSEIRRMSKGVPVIVITGNLESSMMLAAMNLGAAKYLVKPSIIDGLEKAAVEYQS